jgi:hypothetical protein
MNENDQQPPAPNKQTSSVPLKKETVRVTLKASDAPPASPIATVPGAPPVRPPSAPVAGPAPTTEAPRPTAPARTIALKPAGGSTTSPTPTIKLATSSAPFGAPTIALQTATQPAPRLAAPTLPKATVQLQAPTQPMSVASAASSQLATLKMDEPEEEVPGSTLLKVLSIVGFLAACVLLYFQYDISNTWINARDRDPVIKGDFMQLLEPEPNS